MIKESELIEGRTYWYGLLGFKSGSSFRCSSRINLKPVKASYKNGRWLFLDKNSQNVRGYCWYGNTEIIAESEEEAKEEWNSLVYRAEEKLNSWVRARKKELSALLHQSSPLPMVQNADKKA